jgi:hypothetical protein
MGVDDTVDLTFYELIGEKPMRLRGVGSLRKNEWIPWQDHATYGVWPYPLERAASWDKTKMVSADKHYCIASGRIIKTWGYAPQVRLYLHECHLPPHAFGITPDQE